MLRSLVGSEMCIRDSYYYYASKVPPRNNAGWPSMMTVVFIIIVGWLAGLFLLSFQKLLCGGRRWIHSVGEWQTNHPSSSVVLACGANSPFGGRQPQQDRRSEQEQAHVVVVVVVQKIILVLKNNTETTTASFSIKKQQCRCWKSTSYRRVIALGCSSRRDEQAARLFLAGSAHTAPNCLSLTLQSANFPLERGAVSRGVCFFASTRNLVVGAH